MRNIWGINEEKLEKLTDDMVVNTEKNLGVKLPKSYIELCKVQNGGYTIYDAFPTSVPTGWAEDHVSVHYINGIGKEGILTSDYYIEEWELPKDIVLLCGDGHWWIAMDYRNAKENPPVIYIDLEWGEDIFILELAHDFETFMNGLYVHKD
ncbi:SMI1/KNR4 family protein [Bacillus sp. UNC322MFChir4.1]|uniref:SMI1/KNR4 family protein n=1 Tax=Bacillus sp. UNC322MFChir4.1 TaxID=1449045 RepID=UPI000556032F|nr:SMI1/KNR4 family protein [Bacillus sp. UNC322MFChir4.1]